MTILYYMPNPVFISTPFLKIFIKLVEDSCIFLLELFSRICAFLSVCE